MRQLNFQITQKSVRACSNCGSWARGVKLGRPKVAAKTAAAIGERLGAGMGIVKVAKTLGVGVSTVQRIRGEMRDGGPRLSP